MDTLMNRNCEKGNSIQNTFRCPLLSPLLGFHYQFDKNKNNDTQAKSQCYQHFVT